MIGNDELIREIQRLQAIAAEFAELRSELEDNRRHLAARAASYRHKAEDGSFEDGKARAYGVAASDIAFTLERSRNRLTRAYLTHTDY